MGNAYVQTRVYIPPFVGLTDSSLAQLDLEERKQALARAVIGPLKTGLHSFNTVSVMLLSVDADILLPGCQTFNEIREQIESMKLEFEKSEQKVRTELQQLDGETERLTAEQSRLAEQKKMREGEREKIETQLNSHRSSLKDYEASVNTARRNLSSAEDTLNSMRQKRDESQTVRNVGIGLFAIPIFGWIAGSVMVGVGQTDMNRYTDAVDTARSEVNSSESKVRSYKDKVSEYESKIQQAQRDILLADKKICETVATLQDLSVKREVVSDVQNKIRQAVRHLGQLSGVGNAAELQTRRLILLEPVMKVMEEMTSALGQIAGDDLLHSEGIKSLIEDMKNNQKKLQEKAMDEDQSANGYY